MRSKGVHSAVSQSFRIMATILCIVACSCFVSYGQIIEDTKELEESPSYPPLNPIINQSYDDLFSPNSALDLRVPSNIRTVVEFDPTTRLYTVMQKIGEWTVSEPLILTEEEYNRWQMALAMESYWRSLNNNTVDNKNPKNPFNPLDMNFAMSKLDRIFGPGGLSLRTRGSVQLKMGIRSNKTDNPALAVNSRRKTFFDFDQKIQATVNATLGERLRFDMTYNTDATFDFDSKNLKLAYEGNEDDILQSIEAGNVSMTTGSSLIRGASSLFGIKTKLQFGKLTATALVSQQNSESRSVNTRGGVQSTEFSIPINEYDQNRHFFLSQWFRENYDKFAANLPLVSSGVKISRIEVWITNRNSNFEQSRNLVAFQDMGESSYLANSYWLPDPSYPNPSNSSNNLPAVIKTEYPDARDIAMVTQALSPLGAYGIQGGVDYEKVESARLLGETEYILNPTLGYISLKTALSSDEVLAVAYEYTYNGKVFQVGEFSSDITATDQSLYVKMLRATSISPRYPMWRLMMKNIYSIGAYQMEQTNFKLQIKYLSDTTGTQLMYLPVEGISNTPLLQIMGLDRLDSNQLSNPDGFFDYLEGYTVISSMGRIIFPVAEPFGTYLESKLPSSAAREKYVYKELYDSTYVVAAQFSEKNKYYLTGEYQASSGAQIRLNAVNVARGSVVVMAGSTRLTENVDYTVDYAMGIVTITNQSIIDSGQNISVQLENQSLYSTQRKTLLGLDLQYQVNRNLNIGGTILHYSEKALTEKVNIGDEVVNNTMWGLNLSYNNRFMWLTNLINKIPTVNATAPSSISINAEFAQIIPHSQSNSAHGASYIDDFEESQVGIDLRSPYAWQLASTPYESGSGALFPEAALINNIDYGKNRALLAWNYIDRMFTDRNSTLCPGYIKSDLKQLSNPYVREVTSQEIFPGRELTYGESALIQTLNLSFYPSERGPYNLDATNIDDNFNLLYPEKRWGGIMRRMDNTNFEQSNIEYLQFWMMSPFLDPENPNYEGGDLYINFGDISEDILKDGKKSYENGIPVDGNDTYLAETVWGRVSTQSSLTYSFDNNTSARPAQDVGLDGLPNEMEYNYPSYRDYLGQLEQKLPPATVQKLREDPGSPFNDPAGDNYFFFRGRYYDEQRMGILERYKRYNGVEGNSLSAEMTGDPLYQSSRNTPDVEDINQDNTLNEYERYFQYKISIRPEDFVVGQNYITDKQTSLVRTRDGESQEVEWYQFKIPLSEYEKVVGSISDFTTIRFMRMFMTGFRNETHLRFGTLELVRGEWRPYDFNLSERSETRPDGELDVTVVNIEENASRQPVNYVLPPGVNRVIDPAQTQITQLNEQSLSLTVRNLAPADARAIYRNTQLDLRNYGKLQMWVHAEALIDNSTNLNSGELSLIIRLGTDSKNNYYQYEIPLNLTPPGQYNNNLPSDREIVWPISNYLDLDLQRFVELKQERNRKYAEGGSGVSYNRLYTLRNPDDERKILGVMGNPTLSDVRVMLIGVKNNAPTLKSGTVWVNELKVTDFNESGGWAFNGNMNLAVSDIATVNMTYRRESAGFGNVDQGLNSRRLDTFSQYAVGIQADLGRFLPEKAKLSAPIYYSYSNEKTTPKYNPLDQDVLLKDALDATATKEQRDSIMNFALDQSRSSAFSLSGFKFDIRSETPKPWDPANFTLNFSFNKQNRINPTTEYENINDYRGSFMYDYSPLPRGVKPLGWIKSGNANLKFFKEWEFYYLPTNINFFTTISRYYYELQSRSALDESFQLPVSVSKNFLWDRQFNLSWNLTRQLSFTFTSNTSARIEETVGAVNKKLFPDEYKQWKDTVWSSILHLGTPWAYNQAFNANYRAPFNRIPVLDFLTASASYNALYTWDRGTNINGMSTGNSIASQGTWNIDGRLNFEGFYNKIPYLKRVNQRFSSSSRGTERRARRMERNYSMFPDSSLTVRHNLRSKKVKVSVTTLDDKPLRINTRILDNNSVEVSLRRGPELIDSMIPVKMTVTEVLSNDRNFWGNVADYSARTVMSVRSLSIRWRRSSSLSLPLFANDIGDWFGQSGHYGAMSPGLDFAFGFAGEDYVYKAKGRGWLITDNGQTSPALWARAKEMNIEIGLEPVKGLKIILTSNHTDSRTKQIQFMYEGNPSTLGGSFVKTHWALASALRGSSAKNGYNSEAFNRFLRYIPIVAERVQGSYAGTYYPSTGFLEGTPYAGSPYDPEIGGLSTTSPDVLIPAFIAAYSGYNPEKVYLTPFPSLKFALPNWRVTYEGFPALLNINEKVKSIVLTHAYQCTYTVGSYSSYLNWQSAGTSNGDLGFILNELTGRPEPSSPYNISSVAITERFAPLIGVSVALKNDMTFGAEWRDQRTLTLNSSAGQVVEATTSGLTLSAGYKIVGFNTFLKIKNSQKGVSNDLTLNAEFSWQNTNALIRRIETAYTQATAGTRTLGINFTANYILSKRFTIGAYFDHQVNTPLVTNSSYPTTNTAYGIILNLSLAR